MAPIYTPATPARPAMAYLGGKRNLARRLVEIIGAIPHQTYAEVFVGGAGVFLRRPVKPVCEVINDYSQDVATFYRVLQHHYVAFLDMLRFQITTRAEFDRLTRVDPSTLTDMQRAARFLYLQRVAFGGKVTGQNFAMTKARPGRFDVTKLGPLLEDLHERLAGVVVERLPWQRLLAHYDSPQTLFYLDPPYYGCEQDYGADLFDRDQFTEMAEQLLGLNGHFVLSLNDRPEVREIFRRFTFEEVGVSYGIAASGATQARELIITR